MSVYQSVAVRFYTTDGAESQNKIQTFFTEYFELFKKSFGDGHYYLGAFPVCDEGIFFCDEKYLQMLIAPCKAWSDWDTNVKFLSSVLEAGICSKIVVIILQDNGNETIYKNETPEEDAFFYWKKHSFDMDGMYDGSFEDYLGIYDGDLDPDSEEDAIREEYEGEYPNGSMDEYIEAAINDDDAYEWEEI